MYRKLQNENKIQIFSFIYQKSRKYLIQNLSDMDRICDVRCIKFVL